MTREYCRPEEELTSAVEAEEQAQENREITARVIEDILSRSSIPGDDDIDEDLIA